MQFEGVPYKSHLYPDAAFPENEHSLAAYPCKYPVPVYFDSGHIRATVALVYPFQYQSVRFWLIGNIDQSNKPGKRGSTVSTQISFSCSSLIWIFRYVPDHIFSVQHRLRHQELTRQYVQYRQVCRE